MSFGCQSWAAAEAGNASDPEICWAFEIAAETCRTIALDGCARLKNVNEAVAMGPSLLKNVCVFKIKSMKFGFAKS